MKDDEQCGVIFEVVDNENVFLRYQGDVFQQTIGGRLIKDALPNDFASVQYHTPVNQAYMEHGLSVLLDRILFAAQKKKTDEICRSNTMSEYHSVFSRLLIAAILYELDICIWRHQGVEHRIGNERRLEHGGSRRGGMVRFDR